MVQVKFATPEPGFKRRLGLAAFPTLTPDKQSDFSCSPADIISLEMAKRIAAALTRGEVVGRLDGMEWRRDKPMK